MPMCRFGCVDGGVYIPTCNAAARNHVLVLNYVAICTDRRPIFREKSCIPRLVKYVLIIPAELMLIDEYSPLISSQTYH